MAERDEEIKEVDIEHKRLLELYREMSNKCLTLTNAIQVFLAEKMGVDEFLEWLDEKLSKPRDSSKIYAEELGKYSQSPTLNEGKVKMIIREKCLERKPSQEQNIFDYSDLVEEITYIVLFADGIDEPIDKTIADVLEKHLAKALKSREKDIIEG